MMSIKKKRESKTSAQQYEMYLEEMEVNNVFRTGTINPNLPPDYVDTVWKNLVQRLNSCDTGPVLEWNVWKTRFTNWKNSTRAKYRTKVMEVKKTGGGPAPDIKLNPLEKRGLDVWGRVTVSGSPQVPVCGGVQELPSCSGKVQDNVPILLEPVRNVIIEETRYAVSDDEEVLISEAEPEGEPVATKQPVKTPSSKRLQPNTPKHRPIKRKARQSKVIENRTIKAIGEELLNVYSKQSSGNNDLEEKRLTLDVNKLRFDIAKYKYEHPDFEFELIE